MPNIRCCCLVATYIAYEAKDGDLFAGTGSLATMKTMLLWYASSGSEEDVICSNALTSAFLYGKGRRTNYIEIPGKDEWSEGSWVVLLEKPNGGLLSFKVTPKC